MQIRSDLGLPTLRILLDPARTTSAVVFQVVRGRDTPQEVVRCTLEDLGLPENLTGSDSVRDSRLTVPPWVLDTLTTAAADLGPSPMAPEAALWLEFPSPRGFLYVVPWERLLAPMGRSMFRLPNHLVRPQAPASALEVAICGSAPLAKAGFQPPPIMMDLATSYLRRTGRDVRVHMFTDAAWVDEPPPPGRRGPRPDRPRHGPRPGRVAGLHDGSTHLPPVGQRRGRQPLAEVDHAEHARPPLGRRAPGQPRVPLR